MLLIVSVLSFALSQASAGDVADITLRSRGLEVSEVNLAAIKEELGLNDTLPVQYWNWLVKALRFDFGQSFQTHKPVSQEIWLRFPATLKLALTATLLSILYALPIAVLAVRYKDSFVDHSIRVVSTAGATMPDFWLGLMLLYVFAIHLKIVPVISGSKWQNIFLPAFTLSVAYGATYIRILRGNLIEIQNTDYMKAARARGLGQSAALWRHGLRNAVLPLMTLIGLNFGRLLGGQIACETIFSWNGIGKFALDSIKLKDLPVIQGYLMIVALTYILINLLLDIIYVFIDPKIKLGWKS